MINSATDQSSKRSDFVRPLHLPVLTARSSFDGQEASEIARGRQRKANTTPDGLEHPRIVTSGRVTRILAHWIQRIGHYKRAIKGVIYA
jgi:hypothetical protein